MLRGSSLISLFDDCYKNQYFRVYVNAAVSTSADSGNTEGIQKLLAQSLHTVEKAELHFIDPP